MCERERADERFPWFPQGGYRGYRPPGFVDNGPSRAPSGLSSAVEARKAAEEAAKAEAEEQAS